MQLAATLVLVVYAHTYIRGRPRGQAHLHRTFFMAGSTMLATFAAAGSYQHWAANWARSACWTRWWCC